MKEVRKMIAWSGVENGMEEIPIREGQTATVENTGAKVLVFSIEEPDTYFLPRLYYGNNTVHLKNVYPGENYTYKLKFRVWNAVARIERHFNECEATLMVSSPEEAQ